MDSSGLGCILVVAGGALVALLSWINRLRRRLKDLEETVKQHTAANQRFGDYLVELRREIRLIRGTGGVAVEPASPPPAASAEDPGEKRPAVADQAPSAETPKAVPTVPAAAPPPLAESPASPAEGQPAAPPPEGLSGGEIPPPRRPTVPAAPPPPPPPASPARPRRPAIDWEAFVGVKLFSWIAGIALVVAAIFFLRYSIEHGWLGPSIRMAIGFLTGAALLAVCEWKVARRYAITANSLDAAGIAILFATSFAAHARWHLFGAGPAFALMVLVTVAAVGLAIRRDSVFIAVLGLLGGFSTPALLSTGEDRPIALFGYLLILNAGLAWVARKKRWPWLTALSFALTAFYEVSWVAKFLTPEKLPLSIGIVLIFPLLAVLALAGAPEPRMQLFDRTAAVASALPLLFGLYLAAVPGYGAHFGILFGFLLIVDVGLSVLAKVRGPELLHPAAGASTLLIFAIWLSGSYTSRAWPGILGAASLFVVFYALFPLLRNRLPGPAPGPVSRAGDWTAAFLLFVFPALAGLEAKSASPALLFATLFGLLVVLAVAALAAESGVLHFVSAFFALAAEAVWSARFLEQKRLYEALLLYAVFALFFLGVPLVASRLRRTLRPEGSGGIVLFASLALLFFLAAGATAPSALWGLALLLSILNLGLIFEAASGRRPLLCVAGLALSWILIGTWWASVPVALLLVPALVVIAGFAVLVVGGSLVLGRRWAGSPIVGQGYYLALVGHVFLLLVASEKPLAIPPWPFLAVLAVLDLAAGAAALAARKPPLHTSAVVASQIVLLFWLTVAEKAPWPGVAILAAIGVGIFAYVWRFLGARAKEGEPHYSAAAAAALVLAQIVAVGASQLSGQPGVPALVVAQAVLLFLILALARSRGWHFLALVALAPSAIAVALWQASWFRAPSWSEEILFATPIYLLFVAYPLVLGRRVEKTIEPHLAAVLAGLPYFLFARHALRAGGYAGVLGALPIALALLMVVLLVRLLRLEAPGRRSLDRLALVAGAALAFVTVAIPVQLDKEWITIGWALQGAALAWLIRRIPHRGLLVWSAGLMLAVFVRLGFNEAVWMYHPRGAFAVWNWYLYTYLVPIAALFAAARGLQPADDRFGAKRLRVSWLYSAAGTILLFFLVNIEVADFYSKGPALTFNFLSASLAQDLTYTIGWAVFAIGLLSAGIVMASRATRLAAILLLVVTVAKCFLHDLGRLGGLYRVGSFVGLGISLALVAVLIQKFVLPRPEPQGAGPA